MSWTNPDAPELVLCISNYYILLVLAIYALIMIIAMFDTLYWHIESLLLWIKCIFRHQDLHIFGFKLNKYDKFSPIRWKQ